MLDLTYRLEICGGIASGKTTLAGLLARLQITPVLENFLTNPFWRAFYADPVANSFETEISFLLQHYHETKVAQKQEQRFVCDFSAYLDLAYAHVTLKPKKLNAFLSVYHEIKEEIGHPLLLIQLRCNPEIELQRIRNRGRSVEKSITVDYLHHINIELEQVLVNHAFSREILTIDSGEVDFANDESGKAYVLDAISHRIGSNLSKFAY